MRTKRRRQGHGAWRLLVVLACVWGVACARLPDTETPPPTATPQAMDAPGATYQMGLTQLTSGDYLQARRSLEQAVALAPRRYRPEEVLAWRQDWGTLSPPIDP